MLRSISFPLHEVIVDPIKTYGVGNAKKAHFSKFLFFVAGALKHYSVGRPLQSTLLRANSIY
jgi:hypothetical protein